MNQIDIKLDDDSVWAMKPCLSNLLHRIEDFDGPYVEMGAGHGKTIALLCKIILEEDLHQRDVWGFDSFEAGYPQISTEDKNKRSQGGWKTSFDKATACVLQSGYKPSKIRLVSGFFENTLHSNFPMTESIPLLNLDCNLYSSYKFCLNEMFDMVPQGGIIMLDEYKSTAQLRNCPGAATAIDEFFEQRGLDWNNIQYFDSVIHRRPGYEWRKHFYIKEN